MMRMLTALVLVLTASQARADEPKSSVGRKVENFTLKDCQGAAHSLDQYKDKKLVVLAFLGTECPLVKQYGPRLEELQKHFADVNEDVRQILISADKIEKRAGRIEELDFSKEPAETPRLVKGAAELFPLPRKLQAGE